MPLADHVPFQVFGDMRSGNCWKVRWTLELLDLPYQWHETDIMAGASRTPQFLARNPGGRVPLLETASGAHLAESNAIAWFLAEGSALLPADRLERALVMQWQCFEQYSHEPYIAVARFIRQFLDWPNPREAEYHAKKAGGEAALQLMEAHLSERDWFVGATLTLADICLYAYTHVAPEGGFELTAYPSIVKWLARCKDALPELR